MTIDDPDCRTQNRHTPPLYECFTTKQQRLARVFIRAPISIIINRTPLHINLVLQQILQIWVTAKF